MAVCWSWTRTRYCPCPQMGLTFYAWNPAWVIREAWSLFSSLSTNPWAGSDEPLWSWWWRSLPPDSLPPAPQTPFLLAGKLSSSCPSPPLRFPRRQRGPLRVPSDSCRWSQPPGWDAARAPSAGPGAARASQATSFPLPPLLCGPLHIPTNRVRRKGNRARLADGCQVSLKSWLNKGKQITKMEIFKPAFSGIQIDVWVARRHRPRSCYFVIKMIRKIPPCWGFLLPKRLVSFPLRISPFFGERQPPDHSRTANIRWNLASADFFFPLKSWTLKKKACTSQSGEIQIKKKFLGTFPGSSAFCIRNAEFCDSMNRLSISPRCHTWIWILPETHATLFSSPLEWCALPHPLKNGFQMAIELGFERFYFTVKLKKKKKRGKEKPDHVLLANFCSC